MLTIIISIAFANLLKFWLLKIKNNKNISKQKETTGRTCKLEFEKLK